MLGPLAVWTDDGEPVRVPEAKVRALLAVLLAAEGEPVSADRIADDLWGADLPGDPANTLQTKVSQLRRTLDRAEPGARGLVTHQARGYRLASESVDVRRFRELTSSARLADDTGEKVRLLTEALGLWRGPACADFADEPFAAAMIQRLDEERLAATEDLAEARLAAGERGALIGELAELISRHPLRERLRGLRMRALYQDGRQGDALADFAELRTGLAEDLGLEPGPELAELHQAILRQDPALHPAPPPRTNLPAAVTELLGRTGAIVAIRGQVGAARLVTLTGPGGVGKTRLAEECARELVDGFADGVWLVEFAGLRADWVVAAVAAALGVREEAGRQPGLTERLVDVVRGKEILLVLDNCEQLVEPLAELVARLLRAAPGLRVLATSQEPLGLAGEVLWQVAPLDVPEEPPADRPDEQVLAAVRDFSSVRLFAARASASSDFALDAANARAVAALCRRLDGIPLALELAATRVRALGVHEVLARLDDRFRLLVRGRRDAPARQQTLRAVIDWSWGLLTEPERVVLRRLAVHAEGCGLDAAEAVCSGEGVRAGEVVDLLARLVDRSLVVSRPGPRYRLLESVAAYALEQAGAELPGLRDRHARFYLGLAERADPLLRGREQQRWLERLDAETANLRAALETLDGEPDLALRLVRSLTWYWFLRGRFREARESLRTVPDEADIVAWRAALAVLAGEPVDDDAFGQADRIEDPALRARTLWFLGYVKSTIGDLAEGATFTDRALRDFEQLGDRWGVAAAHSDRTSQALAKGEIDLARREAQQSAELFGELGDRWGQLQASFALGTLAETTGDYAQAARLHEEGLRRAEELGLLPEVSYQLSWLGRIALLTGDFRRAHDYHQRASRLAAEQGFKSGEVYAETGLALGERRQGRLDAAEAHLHTVLSWYREAGFEPSATLILAELGFVAELRGDEATAYRWQSEGFRLALRTGDPRALALAVEGLAGVHALRGDHARAAQLLGAAANARASVGTPLPAAESGDVERIAATARTALGESDFTAEFDRGRALRVDDPALG